VIELDPKIAVCLLEELVYQRVHQHVDTMDITWLERDLDDAVQRVVEMYDDDGRDEVPSRAIAAALVDRAWQRVEDDWRAQRDLIGDDCALCELDIRLREELRREGRS
jgi:hypothetical protein